MTDTLDQPLLRGLQRDRSARRRWSPRRMLARNPFLLFGATICLLIAIGAIAGPYVVPYEPAKQNFQELLQAPSLSHPLGTDDLGRDVLSRMLTGARVSLTVALLAAIGASFVGGAVGLTAGYLGGWTESVLMRFMDALFAFPALVLAIAIVGTLGTGSWQAIVAIAMVAVPRFARMMRAQTLRLRHRDFVVASRVAGAGPIRIAVKHILPNAVGVVIILASSTAGFAVLTEASLSFLGLGVRPPTPAWGSMLKSGYQFLDRAPWLAIVPGVGISILVLGFNLAGDGLRDLLDPRTR